MVFAPEESPNARRRSRLPPTQSAAQPTGTRRKPVVAMGASPAHFVCGGGSLLVVATTERPSLPAVGNSRRTLRPRHPVCHLCLRTQARGFRAPEHSQG